MGLGSGVGSTGKVRLGLGPQWQWNGPRSGARRLGLQSPWEEDCINVGKQPLPWKSVSSCVAGCVGGLNERCTWNACMNASSQLLTSCGTSGWLLEHSKPQFTQLLKGDIGDAIS